MHNASYYKCDEQLSMHESNPFRMLTISYPVFHAFIIFFLCNTVCGQIYKSSLTYLSSSRNPMSYNVFAFIDSFRIVLHLHCYILSHRLTHILSSQTLIENKWLHISLVTCSFLSVPHFILYAFRVKYLFLKIIYN